MAAARLSAVLAAGTALVPALQSQSRPIAFFVAGVLIALVPVLLLGGLGGVVLVSYVRDAKSRKARRLQSEAREAARNQLPGS